MRLGTILFAQLIFCCSAVYATPDTLIASRVGRAIQPDGFLIEWRESDARKLKGFKTVTGDVVNTKKGIAGYFHFTCADTQCCTFSISYSPVKAVSFAVLNTDSVRKEWYGIDKISNKGNSSIVAEWILPWHVVSMDSAGAYTLLVTISGPCLAEPESLVLKGMTQTANGSLNDGILYSIGGVVFLLMLALLTKKWIADKNRRRKNFAKVK